MKSKSRKGQEILDEWEKLHGRISKLEGADEDRIRAQEALRDSEEKYRRMFEASTDAVFLESPDGKILDCNQRACEMYGYTKEELIGLSVADIVPEEIARMLPDVIQKHLSDGGILIEAKGLRKDGSVFPNEVSTRLVSIGGKQLVVVFLRDITEQKRTEEELKGHREKLEELVAERTRQLTRSEERYRRANLRLEEVNAELDAFAHSVSHDLRAPLRTVQGLAMTLLDLHSADLSPEGQEFARRIMESVRQLETLIQDLLTYSRLSRTEIRPEAVDLDVLLADVLLQLENEIGERQARVEVERPLPVVRGHRATLLKVMENLISNAVKFVDAGTLPEVRVWAQPTGTKVRLWVEDNGIGIPSQEHERIFRILERLHGSEEFPGTGIGLAVVAKGVARMGARVGVESEPARGSRFWVELDS
jgi:PAS domain S-box-containing protein